MWGWLRRRKKERQVVRQQAEKQAAIVAKARELMGQMDNWQEFKASSDEQLITGLMNIGFGIVQSICQARLAEMEGARGRKGYLN